MSPLRVAAGALSLVLTACSGGGAPRATAGSPPPAARTPAQLVHAAPGAARAAGTARFTFELRTEQPGGFRGRMTGSGVVDFARDEVALDADYAHTSSPAPEHTALHFRMRGTHWWVRVPDGLDEPKLPKPWADAMMSYVGYGVFPVAPLPAFLDVLRAATDVTPAGPGTYAARVPIEGAAATAPESLRGGTRQIWTDTVGGPLPVEVTLDDAGRPRRVVTEFDMVGDGPHVRTVTDFSGYGTPVAIDIPGPRESAHFLAVTDVMALIR